MKNGQPLEVYVGDKKIDALSSITLPNHTVHHEGSDKELINNLKEWAVDCESLMEFKELKDTDFEYYMRRKGKLYFRNKYKKITFTSGSVYDDFKGLPYKTMFEINIEDANKE